MNERIKELAEQADIKFDVYSDNYGVDTATVVPYDLEKFAELIVGKCVDICKEQSMIVSQKYGPASLNMSFMANDCAQAIKEHFKE